MKALLGGDVQTVFAILKAHINIYLHIGYWIKARKQTFAALDKIPKPGAGYYNKSVVWQYFIKGKKRFQDLP
jgi:hypothetical protein